MPTVSVIVPVLARMKSSGRRLLVGESGGVDMARKGDRGGGNGSSVRMAILDTIGDKTVYNDKAPKWKVQINRKKN